jgi:glycosyltransferase involved in cell wall biosynthesis
LQGGSKLTKLKNVTAVIPLYNRAKYIKRALNSILSQTHQCFEIIVVNDGSTDNGPTIAAELGDTRIRVINQYNMGESAARNKGIAEAKHDLIAFLDADDQWDPEFLKNCIRIAEAYPRAGMIGTAYRFANPEGILRCPEFRFVPQKEGYVENFFKSALTWNPVCSSAAVVHKSVFVKLGGFTEGMHYGPDSFMWSKIALNYPVAFINKYLAIVHEDAPNRVLKSYSIVNDFPLFEYFASLDKAIDDEEYFYMKEYIYHKYLLIAGRYLRNADKNKASLYLSKAKDTKLKKNLYISGRLALLLPNPGLKIFTRIWDNIIN